jgi:hypothetical protein
LRRVSQLFPNSQILEQTRSYQEMAYIMTTLAHTGTVLSRTGRAQTRRRTMLVSLAAIALIIGVTSGLAYNQLDGAMILLESLLSGNRFSAADSEMLRILSAAFAPSIIGLLLAFFGSGLQDDGQQ